MGAVGFLLALSGVGIAIAVLRKQRRLRGSRILPISASVSEAGLVQRCNDVGILGESAIAVGVGRMSVVSGQTCVARPVAAVPLQTWARSKAGEAYLVQHLVARARGPAGGDAVGAATLWRAPGPAWAAPGSATQPVSCATSAGADCSPVGAQASGLTTCRLRDDGDIEVRSGWDVLSDAVLGLWRRGHAAGVPQTPPRRAAVILCNPLASDTAAAGGRGRAATSHPDCSTEHIAANGPVASHSSAVGAPLTSISRSPGSVATQSLAPRESRVPSRTLGGARVPADNHCCPTSTPMLVGNGCACAAELEQQRTMRTGNPWGGRMLSPGQVVEGAFGASGLPQRTALALTGREAVRTRSGADSDRDEGLTLHGDVAVSSAPPARALSPPLRQPPPPPPPALQPEVPAKAPSPPPSSPSPRPCAPLSLPSGPANVPHLKRTSQTLASRLASAIGAAILAAGGSRPADASAVGEMESVAGAAPLSSVVQGAATAVSPRDVASATGGHGPLAASPNLVSAAPEIPCGAAVGQGPLGAANAEDAQAGTRWFLKEIAPSPDPSIAACASSAIGSNSGLRTESGGGTVMTRAATLSPSISADLKAAVSSASSGAAAHGTASPTVPGLGSVPARPRPRTRRVGVAVSKAASSLLLPGPSGLVGGLSAARSPQHGLGAAVTAAAAAASIRAAIENGAMSVHDLSGSSPSSGHAPLTDNVGGSVLQTTGRSPPGEQSCATLADAVAARSPPLAPPAAKGGTHIKRQRPTQQ